MRKSLPENSLSVAAIYLIAYDRHLAPRVAFLERQKPDVFGHRLSLPGGSTIDRSPTQRRVKRRTAMAEAYEEVGIRLCDQEVLPAQRNPSITTHGGVPLAFYTYFTVLSSSRKREIKNLEVPKHKGVVWLTVPEILSAAFNETIHPAVARGWWWQIAAFDFYPISVKRQNDFVSEVRVRCNQIASVLDSDVDYWLARLG